MLQAGIVLGMQSQVYHVPLFESSTWAPWGLGNRSDLCHCCLLVSEECLPRDTRESGCGDRQSASIFTWERELLMSGCQRWALLSSACHRTVPRSRGYCWASEEGPGFAVTEGVTSKTVWENTDTKVLPTVAVRKINNGEHKKYRKRTNPNCCGKNLREWKIQL